MKKRLSKICSIILVISILLGNVGSLAVDATDSTETAGMTFSEYRKGVIDNVFESDSNLMTVEATIKLSEDASLYDCVILSARGKSKLPELNFGIRHLSGKARPWIYYMESGMNSSYNAYFDYDFLAEDNYEQTHITFILGTNEEGTATTVACYIDGTEVALSSDSPDYTTTTTVYGQQPAVMFDQPTIAYCVGGDYASNQSARYFKGEIYSIATYADARTGDEIATDIDGIDDMSDENLMVYYDLTTVTDATTKVANGSTADTAQQYALNVVETWMTERKPALDNWSKDNGDFSIALVGDTQIATEYDVSNGYTDGNTGVVSGIYDWLVENKEEKNIQFVMGLGDIVQGTPYAYAQSGAKADDVINDEWAYAVKQIQKLDSADIPYSLIRGNHDAQDKYIENVTYDYYKDSIAGSLDENMLNTWQEFVVNDIKYLVLCLDLGASDTELAWAEEVIKAHPKHNIIITTHGYMNSNGERLAYGDTFYPSQYPSAAYPSNRNDGEDMWTECFSKYDNVVMVVSGHIDSDDIIMTQDTGVNGNKVAQLLVNPQGLDVKLAKSTTGDRTKPTGMVCILNFSADGKTVQVEQISTAYIDETTGENEYYMNTSQFEFEMNVVEAQKLLFNTQQMSTEGNQTFTAYINNAYCNTSCATKSSQVILNTGYTNIISYTAPSDGLIKISDMSVKFHGSLTSTTSEIYKVVNGVKTGNIEFAVTNGSGEIISNGGRVLRLSASQPSITGLTVDTRKIEKGDSIHFVFHCVEGSINIIDCIPKIEFSIDDGENWSTVSRTTGVCVPWPAATDYDDSNAEQGMGDFTYNYSIAYEKEICKNINKRLVLNTKLMSTSSTSTSATSNTVSLNDPNTSCWTCVPQIIVTANKTNVISYQAKEDGYIWIDKMHVWKRTLGEAYDVDFAVVNEKGEILSNSGEIYNLGETGYDKIATALSETPNIVVPKQEIKAGESIYFVFHGNAGTTSVRCAADIQFCAVDETVGTQVGYGYDEKEGFSLRNKDVIASTLAQGLNVGDFFYGYSNIYEIVDNYESEHIHMQQNYMSDYTTKRADFPFGYSGSCMTSPSEIIVAPGYTNVIAYQAKEAGILCIKEMQVWVGGDNKEANHAEFSVVNEEGKIISNNGSKYVFCGNTTGSKAKELAENLTVSAIEMEANERIYFVFHGLSGSTMTLRCNAKILFGADNSSGWEHVNDSTVYKSGDMTLYSIENYLYDTTTKTSNGVTPTQGVGGFHYMYITPNTLNPTGVTIGDEKEGIVTVYETLADDTYYYDKYLIDAEVETVDSVTKAKNYIDIDMLNIKKQSQINADDTTRIDVRYIASVDNLNYKSVGFVFSNKAENQVPTIDTVGEKAHKPTNTVYARVLEGDGSRKAENIYAEDGCHSMYGFAFEIRKTPANSTVYARAYVELNDGTIVYGTPRAVTTTSTGTVD